jgi:MFS family permease
MCWFNLAAAFPAMSGVFHYSLRELALLTASFLFGAGLFQVPAGVYSAQRGATKATLLGLTIIAITSTASAASGQFYFQLVNRFFTGLGAAFYFAPAMVIVSGVLGERKSGLAIGVYNGAFNLGGGIALFAFTPLAEVSWRIPFIVTSVLTFIALGENAIAFRGIVEDIKAELSKVRTTLRSKDIWTVIIAILGVNAANYVVSQFSVAYAEGHLGFSPIAAGTLSSLILFGALIGGPVGGWISDKIRNRRFVIMLSATGVGLSVALFVIENSYAAWFAMFFTGFFMSSVYTNTYVFPIQLPEIGRKYAPLAAGLLNSVGITDGAICSALFAQLVLASGYPFAWSVLAVTGLVFGPFVYLAREPFSISSNGPKK